MQSAAQEHNFPSATPVFHCPKSEAQQGFQSNLAALISRGLLLVGE
jgi:hypothetical protein